MKMYTPYRAGLLIGLLSFSILASCVNTRKELGWCPNRQELGLTAGNIRRSCNGCSTCSKILYCCCACIVCTPVLPIMFIAGAGWIGWLYIKESAASFWHNNNNNMRMHMNNSGINAANATLFAAGNRNITPVPNGIDETTAKFILDSIENEPKWRTS